MPKLPNAEAKLSVDDVSLVDDVSVVALLSVELAVVTVVALVEELSLEDEAVCGGGGGGGAKFPFTCMLSVDELSLADEKKALAREFR